MAHTMICPRCFDPLDSVRVEEHEHSPQARQCPTCQGLFLDAGKLEHLDGQLDILLFENRKIPTEEVQDKPITCPACGGAETMSKVVHDRDDAVVMDVCGTCGGTWLDGGELEAIRAEGLLNWVGRTFSFSRKKT